jgi:hypothetical protein
MSINRRQFDRLQLSEAAYAVGEDGRQLGKVSQASGGGMLILSRDAGGYTSEAESPAVGERFTVTIMEPHTQTSNRLDVIVRYKDGDKTGLEFVGKE